MEEEDQKPSPTASSGSKGEEKKDASSFAEDRRPLELDGAKMSPPPAAANRPKMTLVDVQNAFPAESSEERIVMEHIERTDPTVSHQPCLDEMVSRGGRLYTAPSSRLTDSDRSRPLLVERATSIPVELVETLQAEKMEEMQKEDRRAAMERSKSRKSFRTKTDVTMPKTVEDELFELTNILRPRQSMILENTSDSDAEENEKEEEAVEHEDETKPLTQQMAFAKTAAGMFQNLQKQVAKRTPSFSGLSIVGTKRNEDGEHRNDSESSKLSIVSSHRKSALQNMREVERIIKRNQKSIYHYVKMAMLWLVLPSTAVAFLLYYVFDNPGAAIIYVPSNSTNSSSTITYSVRTVSNDQPSYSWLILFFGVRQVITFGLAFGCQHLVVTYYQQAGLNFVLVGPMFRLLIIQAKVSY
jgi:hypothetical protein